ncbi:ATP-binding cassette domain-containing protein [Clostridioides difficile]|uniref:ATP-binding cassette domain-containing protein n=1 Tax=Clostridioides difficile TaxID=1496 RepID=UPI001EEEFA50|nr:ATP-binding cassette domain-containing protein [Clostridioides difficile]
MDLKKYLDIKVQYLSGGQRQSLSLIMSSLASPKVLLLDEHPVSIDTPSTPAIIKLNIFLLFIILFSSLKIY